MALDDAARTEAARALARDLIDVLTTATMNLDDYKAAVASIDDSMETVINTIPAGQQNKTVKNAIIDALPQPFKSGSTPAEKAVAMSFWALKEAGVI